MPVGEIGLAADHAFEVLGVLLVVGLLVAYGPRHLARSGPDPVVPGGPPSAASSPE